MILKSLLYKNTAVKRCEIDGKPIIEFHCLFNIKFSHTLDFHLRKIAALNVKGSGNEEADQ